MNKDLRELIIVGTFSGLFILGCYLNFKGGYAQGKLEAKGSSKDWCDYEYHLNVQEEHGKMFYWVHDVESDVDILRGGDIQSVEEAIIKTNL